MTSMDPTSQRRLLFILLLIAVGLVGWAYRDTFAAIFDKWQNDAAYSHGYLILPISLWLTSRKRAALAATPLRPSLLPQRQNSELSCRASV